MNVLQCCIWIRGYSQIETVLPYRTHADIERNGTFIDIHHFGNRTSLGNLEKKMAMIWHHDECIEKAWIMLLYAVHRFDSNPCTCRIGEDFPAIAYVRCDMHDHAVL